MGAEDVAVLQEALSNGAKPYMTHEERHPPAKAPAPPIENFEESIGLSVKEPEPVAPASGTDLDSLFSGLGQPSEPTAVAHTRYSFILDDRPVEDGF